MLAPSNDMVAWSGQLDTVTLPTLIWDLAKQQWSGILDLTHDSTVKKVFFENGQPVDAHSNLTE